MSPDARLIALALIAQDCGPEEAVWRLGILETALPPVDPQPGIRGMVPVGWVNQMLDELFSVAAQVAPQPVEVGDKIMSIRAQLQQFREDS